MAAEGSRVATGVEGLDAMLGGGFPRGSVILLRGGPGAGKTTLALQFLVEGLRHGEKGLHVSLEESADDIVANAAQYGWDVEPPLARGDLVIHSLRLQRVKDYLKTDAAQPNWIVSVESAAGASGLTGEFRAEALSTILSRLVRETGAKRLVFDSLTMFTAQFEHRTDLHMETLDLLRGITKEGCTALLTSHQDPSGAHVITPEEYLSQGVVSLHSLQQPNRLLQALQVMKMRGSRHDREMRPYRIGERGMTVYHTESVLGGF